MEPRPLLHVITATYNGLSYTQRLIAALTRLAMPVRVVVVDNGSTDDTVDWLTSLRMAVGDKQVPLVPLTIQVIANQTNLGAASAWNQGIRFALANGAEHILVVGNDTIPMPGTIERLIAAADSGVALITGTAVDYATPEHPVPKAQPSDPLIAAPDFSFFLVTRQTIEVLAQWDASGDFSRAMRARESNQPLPPLAMNPWEYGLFDSRYFPAYFEDNDYHARCHLAGVMALRDSGAVFRHETSQTLKSNPEIAQLNEQTFRRNAELFRAKFGKLPHELSLDHARPLNVTDERWNQMSGGRPVQEIDRTEAALQARNLYDRYKIEEVQSAEA